MGTVSILHKLLGATALAAACTSTAATSEETETPGIERVVGPIGYTEGPAVAPDGAVWFTESDPAHAIHRYDPQTGEDRVVFDRSDSGGANGLAWLGDLLIICEDRLEDRVTVVEDPLGEKKKVVLADAFEGRGFNGPNDVTLDYASQTLFFTDPNYKGRPSPAGVEGVYSVRMKEDASRVPSTAKLFQDNVEVSKVNDTLSRPNGIGSFGGRLFVADNEAKSIESFAIRFDGTLSDQRPFADLSDLGGPDGMAIDEEGRVFTTIFDKGVQIITPAGERLGFIPTGKRTSNVAFARDGGLWVTAQNSLFKVSPERVQEALTRTPDGE